MPSGRTTPTRRSTAPTPIWLRRLTHVGGRPGARRQAEDTHMAKLEEIERISRAFAGVDEAFAVQGGREVRVYVDENRVNDEGRPFFQPRLLRTSRAR